MMAGLVSKRVVSDRLAWVERMVDEIQALPLGDRHRTPIFCACWRAIAIVWYIFIMKLAQMSYTKSARLI